ncbi:MAG: NAD(P)H-hydrate dehydratase [Rhodobacteraceae bacterium]|nr:NAD(P)H-hydrate dehydratase [Paracoccaceae bacterium]
MGESESEGETLLTAAEMRHHETAAMASGAVTGAVLMARAGQGATEAFCSLWPHGQVPDRPVTVLCGPGNNGGDGYVVALGLARTGWRVRVLALGDPARLPPDARHYHDLWAARFPVLPLTRGAPASDAADGFFVDALFGTGLTRPLEGAARDAVRWLSGAGRAARTLCLDAPSGLCLDSGRYLGPDAPDEDLAFRATVSFHSPKRGHLMAQGARLCGQLIVKDIGLPPVGDGDGTAAPPARRVAPPPAGRLLKSGAAHKFGYGHVLAMAGPAGHTGAARLAARAALRVGAGLVSVAAPAPSLPELAAHLGAIMLTRIDDGAALSALLARDARISALCAGPALGLGPRAAGLVAAALASGRRAVLDADALTLLARDPDLRGALHCGCVLTPHGGEFARLFPKIATDLAAAPMAGPALSRADAVAAAARALGCVVLLKGRDTVIADPAGRVRIHCADTPQLATAGAGDVLAGTIAGLMARGLTPMTAACDGVWLHAAAARRFGEGLTADDLPDAFPAVLSGLGRSARAGY